MVENGPCSAAKYVFGFNESVDPIMKILRVCPAPSHTVPFRKAHGLSEKSFEDQIRFLRAENLLLPASWASCMEAEGCEVFETLYNDAGLQAQWAKENGEGHLVSTHNHLLKILLAQIKAFQPDVLFFYAGAFFWLPRSFRDELRKVAPNHMVMTGFWGDELPRGNDYASYFGDLDIVFCSSSKYQAHFEAAGIKATTIGNGFDASVVYRKPPSKTRDFIFCGTSGYGYPDHIGRFEKLGHIMSKSPLEMWTNEPGYLRLRRFSKAVLFGGANIVRRMPRIFLYVVWKACERFSLRRFARLANMAIYLKDKNLDARLAFPASSSHPQQSYFDDKALFKSRFPRRVHRQPLNGSDYYTLLAESKLVLNIHRDEDADIGNIRCFEVTGVGSCLVTDRGEELRDFFDIDNDIVTFETPEECVEKIEYLLKNPAKIERIAQNGRRKTMERHTTVHRCHAIAVALRELQSAKDDQRQSIDASHDAGASVTFLFPHKRHISTGGGA